MQLEKLSDVVCRVVVDFADDQIVNGNRHLRSRRRIDGGFLGRRDRIGGGRAGRGDQGQRDDENARGNSRKTQTEFRSRQRGEGVASDSQPRVKVYEMPFAMTRRLVAHAGGDVD